jgi:uncharacterized protein YjiS (DUF1127 family)
MSISSSLPIAVDFPMHGNFGVIGRIRAAIRRTLERRRARHDYEALLGCDDHIFRDVGLTRDDVRSALADCR